MRANYNEDLRRVIRTQKDWLCPYKVSACVCHKCNQVRENYKSVTFEQHQHQMKPQAMVPNPELAHAAEMTPTAVKEDIITKRIRSERDWQRDEVAQRIEDMFVRDNSEDATEGFEYSGVLE